MIRKFIALFFLFIMCCHCKCGWDGSCVYVAIWLLFFSVNVDFSCITLLIPTLMWSSATLSWTGRNKERKWQSFRALTFPLLLSLMAPLLLVSVCKRFSVYHLGCSVLKLRSEPALQGSHWPPLQTFCCATLRHVIKGAPCLLLPPHLLECVRNTEICTQQPELLRWGVGTAVPYSPGREKGEKQQAAPISRHPFRKGTLVLPLPRE